MLYFLKKKKSGRSEKEKQKAKGGKMNFKLFTFISYGKVQCEECGKFFTAKSYTEDLCPVCRKKFICEDCGKRLGPEDGLLYQDGAGTCKECYESWYKAKYPAHPDDWSAIW